ncbi:rhodanese-like domain-containing protein [Geoglobus acetivorans]|uniref:Rhodanese-like domain-containing protein n=1 Tax=Geoglobus acetivorans TaxID=565033 RepID=A0ABZ3H024_GEOAI|nr:rhodanese-like domain-containing protein [Geoglobus acetivorans]
MRKTKYILAAILVLFALAVSVVPGCVQKDDRVLKRVSVDEAYRLIQENRDNPEFIIIDVRTPQEYSQMHIDGAINIDFYSPKFRDELNGLDKSKTYLIYCRTGHRSGEALKIMDELGFEHVYEMEGGIMQWMAKGYPVIK